MSSLTQRSLGVLDTPRAEIHDLRVGLFGPKKLHNGDQTVVSLTMTYSHFGKSF